MLSATTRLIYSNAAFTRRDDGDDAEFYEIDRFVPHLDSLALASVEKLIGALVIESSPAILVLMASWDSHLPAALRPTRVAGLGLNENELARNEVLTERIVRDLNRQPTLPLKGEGNQVATIHRIIELCKSTTAYCVPCKRGPYFSSAWLWSWGQPRPAPG